MSFPQIETKLKKVKDEIREINESIKQLVIKMQLPNITFEGMLKSKQKGEYKPIEIKFFEKLIPNSDDEKDIKIYQEKLFKAQEEALHKTIEEQNRLKGKDKQEESK